MNIVLSNRLPSQYEDLYLKIFLLVLMSLVCFPLSAQQLSAQLLDRVEVVRDQNGINHIFAQNEEDLFFAQGYLAARDRIFQFEIWRRQATGTLAEILGEKELARDIGARLFRFRGDKTTELNHYHPRGEAIVDRFVEGINAYVKECRENPEQLPIEFEMLGILPGYWTWETVVSRHQGLLGNVRDELNHSRVVSLIGPEKAKMINYFHPFEPDLELDPSIPKELLFKDILAPYNAFRNTVAFSPEDVQGVYRNQESAYQEQRVHHEQEQDEIALWDRFSLGSNNWVLSGRLTASGYPYMANDPHRVQAIPSLRYWVRLHAPGWNVVGGGEPVIPGVSIGHNEFGAWGLTIFSTDGEDIRIYDLHPDDSQLYRYKGEWRKMKMIQDTIPVKGREPEMVQHYYTIHGPVTFIDEELGKAVAVECAWLEPGSAPYLASLRMGQADSWESFREACVYNHIPAENMVWADKEGNIGWQATGIAPIRKGFSGLVATVGDGSKEWEGYLPMLERPHAFNPPSGFINTSNENLTDTLYPYPEALGYEWSDPFRGDRVREVLESGQNFTLEDMGKLQNDYLALPARRLVPFLLGLRLEGEKAVKAQKRLEKWDYVLDKNSVAAGIYVMWERKLRENIRGLVVPEEVRRWIGSISLFKALEWIEAGTVFEDDSHRDHFLAEAFDEALKTLEGKLGPDMEHWQYGQERYKHAHIRHPLSAAVSSKWRDKLDAGPVPRGGYSYTPAANAYGDNNTTGASFRILVDTGDWEETLGINTPGHSGDPESPFYRHFFDTWAEDGFFRVHFDRKKVEKSAVEQWVME
ncbi:penicillin acylase family protein [Negadavirga shengliensis]|uniref:Penicillin acylase family protein n=1 Tax=Negadavirga shengliensis TaxID=1389218 RepID=A0ABV9T036_9BACT